MRIREILERGVNEIKGKGGEQLLYIQQVLSFYLHLFQHPSCGGNRLTPARQVQWQGQHGHCLTAKSDPVTTQTSFD